MSWLELWSPVDDPDKPPFRYITGFSTQIQRHAPPPPCGGPHYGPEKRPHYPSEQYLYDVPQSEVAVDHSLLDTPPPSLVETLQMTIHKPISVGSHHGAQVLTFSIIPHEDKPFQAVVKIYDTLYYGFTESYDAYAPRDIVRKAESDYSCEAAAYEYLQATGQTCAFAPVYYGSWTFDLPIVSRQWMAIADSQHSGIDQHDFAGRNVVLAPRAPSTNDLAVIVAGIPVRRIVLIDFNTSIVCKLTEKGAISLMDWPRPENPMNHFWDLPLEDFGGWVPHEWHCNPTFIQHWLQTRFGTEEKRKLYAPVHRELVIKDYDLPE